MALDPWIAGPPSQPNRLRGVIAGALVLSAGALDILAWQILVIVAATGGPSASYSCSSCFAGLVFLVSLGFVMVIVGLGIVSSRIRNPSSLFVGGTLSLFFGILFFGSLSLFVALPSGGLLLVAGVILAADRPQPTVPG